METTDLIMLAAGKGDRMNAPVHKQLLPLGGAPVIVRTLQVFEQLPSIGKRIITINDQSGPRIKELISSLGIKNVEYVGGGTTRHESVEKALERVDTPRVIIQNAVMPFITKSLIERMMNVQSACVTPVSPSPYTVFREAHGTKEEIPQKELRYIKSPQVVVTKVARFCYRQARADRYQATNDVCVFHRYGYDISFVPDDEMNIKLTTKLDFFIAQAIWDQREGDAVGMVDHSGPHCMEDQWDAHWLSTKSA